MEVSPLPSPEWSLPHPSCLLSTPLMNSLHKVFLFCQSVFTKCKKVWFQKWYLVDELNTVECCAVHSVSVSVRIQLSGLHLVSRMFLDPRQKVNKITFVNCMFCFLAICRLRNFILWVRNICRHSTSPVYSSLVTLSIWADAMWLLNLFHNMW
jgi:hypothetical protein